MNPKTIVIEDTPQNGMHPAHFHIHTEGYPKGDIPDIILTLKKAVYSLEQQVRQPIKIPGANVVTINVADLVNNLPDIARRA